LACTNPDGTLTRSAQAVLAALSAPAGEDEIVERTAVPRFQVRSLLRDMTNAKLVIQDAERGPYRLTDDGRDLLETVS
jgi:DNA-binding IclR family transcriptional regulator